MDNVCFICGIDRSTFDRKHAKGFAYHIEHEHNVWHYLAFIIQNLLGPVLDELYREEEDEEEDEEAGDQEAGDQEAGDQGAGNQEAGDQEADLLSEDEGPENPDSE